MTSKNINLVNSDDSINKFKTLISGVIGESVEHFLKIKLNKAFLFDEIVSLITTTRNQTLEDYADLDTFLGAKTRDHTKELLENKQLIENLQKEICELKSRLSDYENKKHVDLIIHDSVVVDDTPPDDEEKTEVDDEEEEDEETEVEEEPVEEDDEEEETEKEDEEEEEEKEVEENEEEEEEEEEEEVEEETETEAETDKEEVETEKEEEEEEEELFEFVWKGITYFINDENTENGDVYEVINGDEPGKLVGTIKNGKIKFLK
jgi:flagellar biosynthesis GTPase FlhF